MSNQQLERARTSLSRAGCDFALLSSMHNVTYVSGYAVPVPIGALATFSYGTPLALIGISGGGQLVTPNGLAAEARATSWFSEVLEFDTFDSFAPADSHASFLQAARTALGAAGLHSANATLGIEARTMPHALSELLRHEFPKLKLVDIEDDLQRARLIKTEREIGLLRQAAAVGDIGHNTLQQLAKQPGLDEFAMWSQILAAMNRAAGTEITVTGELVTGPRTNIVAYPNGPTNRTTQTGDAALMDISGRVQGYWFDCSNTHIIGGAEPTAEQRRYAKASQAACEDAMACLAPGRLASEASEAARQAFEKHGLSQAHYTGHQIGVVVNELPRLVPYDHTPIEAGMVFSVEPGAYQGEGGDFGARSEKMVLVTPTGPEILSQFVWGID